MKKIFCIEHDRTYPSIQVTQSPNATDVHSLQGDEIEQFHQPACYVSEPHADLPNFVYLSDSALVFDQEAYDATVDFIEYASLGAKYPLNVNGVEKKLWLLNVVETCNPVNRKTSQVDPDSWQKSLEMNRLNFHPKRIVSLSSLFKIPELDYKPILCFSGFDDDDLYQEHDFYKTYEEKQLTGLHFKELWRDY